MENSQQPPEPAVTPSWRTDGRKDGYTADRVTLDLFAPDSPEAQEYLDPYIIRVDGEEIGMPLDEEDGDTVLRWLQVALPRLEKVLMEEVERLYEEDDARCEDRQTLAQLIEQAERSITSRE